MPHGAGSKKRKREAKAQALAEVQSRIQSAAASLNGSNGVPHPTLSNAVDTSKPTAVFKPRKGRSHTLSIALPGSIIANCQSHDQKTALAGTIARAAAVFSADEIIIFNDGQTHSAPAQANYNEEANYTGTSNPSDFLFHLLSYLETPPHLRRGLFPMHPNLRTAGTLPSVDMPHHLKRDEVCPYREGVTVSSPGEGTKVDVGLPGEIRIRDQVEPGSRVTIQLPNGGEGISAKGTTWAEAVAPEVPREEGGWYWGYAVRMAGGLSEVFTESPFEDGYDLSIGTSERGVAVDELVDGKNGAVVNDWNHMLVVFGGVAGLEVALQADRALLDTGVTDVKDVFDHWVNLVPDQSSRTIRTEEAVWLGLMGLRKIVTQRSR